MSREDGVGVFNVKFFTNSGELLCEQADTEIIEVTKSGDPIKVGGVEIILFEDEDGLQEQLPVASIDRREVQGRTAIFHLK